MNYKTLVLPVIALIALVGQISFGVTIGEEVQGQLATAIADVIAVGVVVYGIFTNHKKEVK